METEKPTYHDFARWARLSDREIERDCELATFHASGPGGQGVNTADSAVRMRHLPSGITVTSREHRTQLLNRRACVEKLRQRFLERSRIPKRRHATKPTKGSIERRLRHKRARSEVKHLRRKPSSDD